MILPLPEEVPQLDRLVSRGNFLVTGLIVRQLLTSLRKDFVDMPCVVGHGCCPVWYVLCPSAQTPVVLTYNRLNSFIATAVGTDILHDNMTYADYSVYSVHDQNVGHLFFRNTAAMTNVQTPTSFRLRLSQANEITVRIRARVLDPSLC